MMMRKGSTSKNKGSEYGAREKMEGD